MRSSLTTNLLLIASILAITSITSVSAGYEATQSLKLLKSMEEFQLTFFQNFDFLNMYLFCDESVQNCNLMEPLYTEFANTMKDFAKFYVVLCDKAQRNSQGKSVFPACEDENIQNLPYLLGVEPPATRFNSYTKQLSKPIEHVYQGNADVKSLSNFARQHMPVFRESITTKAQLDKFLGDKLIPNKVMLFTNKPQTSPLYKALASEFHDKLLFGEVNESSNDIIQELQVTKFPTLVVMKQTSEGTFAPEAFTGDFQIEKLRSFLATYALEERVEHPRETPSAQEAGQGQQQGQAGGKSATKSAEIKVSNLTAENLEQEVNKYERLVLIHLTTDERVPVFEQVQEKFTIFFEYFNLDCSQPENEAYAREKLGVKSLPALVALPLGKEKNFNNRIQFAKTKTLEEISEGISELVGDKVRGISPEELQGVVSNSLAQKRPAFIFLYDTDEVNLAYRALTQNSKYTNKLTFTKLKNPNAEIRKHFELKQLPALIVVLINTKPGEEDDEIDPSKVQLAKYAGRYNYEDLSKYFDVFLPEEERLQKMKTDRQVTEIKTQADLDSYCPPESRACLLALLNGNRDDPEVSAKLDDNLNTLNNVMKKNPHFPFLWVDAICHSELLLTLNVQSESVPTVVVYSPTLKEYTPLVGTFDSASLSVFLEKVLKRRLSANSLQSGLVIEDKQCSEVHDYIKRQEQGGGGNDDDDIMKEMLADIKKREDEAASNAKGKKKKKKKYNDDL